ncbi:hypothetical protein PCANC_23729 [Puccinia coronata f. sp. avenae]|uniref:Uncharacterized protein n=1 Tax=Puccinia coronata f. sp. avenae TaxID=200324 RepID=A0A2N5SC13_9BASI|nr:hypothetical protein PCANC_23729 [Puccinia coronata f. sp. avenae]
MTDIVIVCRGSYWDTLEAYEELADNWIGQAKQELMDGIDHQFQPISSDDRHFLERTPVDDAFFEDLPAVYNFADNGKSTGVSTSSNNEKSRITRVPLLDRIHLSKENNVHQLVFHTDVFKIPDFVDADSVDELHIKRKELFEKYVDRRQRESRSGSNLAGFLLKRYEVLEFSQSLSGETAKPAKRTKKILRPSFLLPKEINKLFSSSKIWMNVYHRRLEIDFEALQKWTQETLLMSPIRFPPGTTDLMMKFFISYLFFVDTVITVLPETRQAVVNRIEAFRTAVTCFEQHTDKLIAQEQLSPSKLKELRLQLLWSYIEHWLIHDESYKLQPHLWDENPTKLRIIWKTIFNFILTYSTDSLTTEKQAELKVAKEKSSYRPI